MSCKFPYALEFGLLVGETRSIPTVLRGCAINAEDRRAEVTWYHITPRAYSVASNVRRDTTLLIEHRVSPARRVFRDAAPATPEKDIRAGQCAFRPVRLRDRHSGT